MAPVAVCAYRFAATPPFSSHCPVSLSPSSIVPPARAQARLRTLQGAVAALSFSILLAGSNATTPLMPIYHALMGFSPFVMSLTFVCYVVVQIVILVLLSRPSILRWSPALLIAGLLAAVVSDLCMAVGSEFTILLGRALTGVGVGLGTGSAAALVVDAFGARGRSVSATGNLVGAVIGTGLSQLAVSMLEGRLAIGRVFHLHALACSVLLILLLAIFTNMRHSNRLAFGSIDPSAPKVYATLRANWLPLFVGSLSWILLSSAITFLPSFFRESGMPLVTSIGMIVLLVCCAACQLGSAHVARIAPKATGVEAMALGTALILIGEFTGFQSVGLVGFGLTGAGIGITYRICLVVLTRGASPNIHGVLSSTYAAITYAAAALGVIMIGLLGNVLGLRNVVIAALVVLLALCLAVLKVSPRVSAERR